MTLSLCFQFIMSFVLQWLTYWTGNCFREVTFELLKEIDTHLAHSKSWNVSKKMMFSRLPYLHAHYRLDTDQISLKQGLRYIYHLLSFNLNKSKSVK